MLAASAGLKFADRTGTAVALSTYSIGGRYARVAVVALIAWELALAASLLAGWTPGVIAAAGTLVLFTALQIGALVTGRGGMACGCMGGTGRLSVWSALRAGLFASAVLWLASGSFNAPVDQTPWLVVAVMAVAAILVRVLANRAPDGALDVAGEGPELGTYTALAQWLPASDGRIRLALFTSASCRLCGTLGPAMRRLVEEDDVVLRTFEAEREREVWESVDVPGAPYAIAVGTEGQVLAKGTINTERQLRGLVADAHSRHGAADSRREFIGKAAVAATTVGAAATVVSLVAPHEAQAFHFCGHAYTTDGCPHPTGLPRIDSRGMPLRAHDGKRVDDLGRLIDGQGLAVDDSGRPLIDVDGRRLPPAPRTAVCKTVARRYGFRTTVDGAWYRCCEGNVRKLMDCCSYQPTRINGDPGLTGYCYGGRTVFCVMYYDTKIKC